MSVGNVSIRVPNPGTVQDRNVMAVRQPGFLDAYRTGVAAARAACCASGDGNTSHPAVQHYCRFMALGLNTSISRVLDPLSTPLERKLEEVDLIDAFAWWLHTQVGVSTETAWSYVTVVNAWHSRWFYVPLAGGMPLTRIHHMLEGQQRLIGQPITRRRRIGVRPAHLAAGIAAALQPRDNALHASVATAMEVALVAIARAGELVATRTSLSFTRSRHPSRADVVFEYDAAGRPAACTIWIINSKARGSERLRKLPVPIPMTGKHLSPGLALYHLLHVVDVTPAYAAADTPLFRDPRTGGILNVTYIRQMLRACMTAIGRDPSVYGAHSLRIGGATALAFLRVPGDQIQAAGRWHSGAYLRYLRQTRQRALHNLTMVASADTDDMEADFVDVDAHGFNEEDEE